MHKKNKSSSVNQQTNQTIGGYRKIFSYLLLFALLLTASAAYQSGQIAHAAQPQGGTIPSGTIPPGGTIPVPPIDREQGQVRVFHLAPIGSISSSTVDICRQDNTPITGLTGLTYLSQSGYLTLPPGTYDWKVGTPGCATTVLDLPPFQLAEGTALTLLIVGDGVNQPLTSVLLVDANGQIYRQHLPLMLDQ